MPPPPAPSSNLDGGLQKAKTGNSTCPGCLPAGHVCLRPLSRQESAQRLQSPWGHTAIPSNTVLQQQPSNVCPGLWGAPSPNLAGSRSRPAEEQAFIQGHQGTLGRAGWGSLGILSRSSPTGSSLAKPTTASQSSQDIRQLQFLAPYSLETTMSHSYQGKLRHTAKKSQEGSGVGKERLRIPGGRHSWGVP